MLILTRRPKERVCIAGNIWVEIISVQGTRVKLGITAPQDVTVDRAEIHELKLDRRKVGGRPP